MTQDHVRVWLPDNGATPFVFEGDFAVKADLSDEEVRARLSTGETPGKAGVYTDPNAPVDERMMVLKGRFNCDWLTDLQDRFDTLAVGVPLMQPGKFVRRIVDMDTGDVLQSRYLRCRPVNFGRAGERGLPVADWEIGFRTLDDKVLYYEETLRTLPLNVPATTGTITTGTIFGGVAEVLPKIVFQIASIGAGGTITVSHNYADGYAQFTPLSAGAWALDYDADTLGQQLTFAGLSQLSQLSGVLAPHLPGPATLTLIVTGGVVVSSATLTWRRRYPFA